MSRTRMIALIVLALLLAVFAIVTSPTSTGYAWISGRCWGAVKPPVCQPWRRTQPPGIAV